MRNLILLPLISSLAITGCSTTGIKDANLVRQNATAQAQNSEQSPQEVLSASKTKLKDALAEDLSFYSPTYLAEAEKEIIAAEQAMTAGSNPADIIALALTAQKWIQRGLDNKTQVELKLKASLDALAALEAINTPALLPDEFADFKEDIQELAVLLEEGLVEKALLEQKDLLEDFSELEVETLNTAYLSPVQTELEAAEDDDADDYAELTLQDAYQQAEALETYIKTNPRNLEEIAKLSNLALRAAQHAKQVSLAVQPLLRMGPEQAEKHVLAIEAYLGRIGSALQHEDVRHLSLDNQSIAIAQAAETTSRRAQAFERQKQWEQEKVILSSKVDTLQANLHKTEAELTTTQAQLDEARKAIVVNVAPVVENEKVVDQSQLLETPVENAQIAEDSTSTDKEGEASPTPVEQQIPVAQAIAADDTNAKVPADSTASTSELSEESTAGEPSSVAIVEKEEAVVVEGTEPSPVKQEVTTTEPQPEVIESNNEEITDLTAQNQ